MLLTSETQVKVCVCLRRQFRLHYIYNNSVHLLYLVYNEVALVAENCGCLSVLFGQQIEPLSHSIHHCQNYGPQEAQNIQDPLQHLTMTCSKQAKRCWRYCVQ